MFISCTISFSYISEIHGRVTTINISRNTDHSELTVKSEWKNSRTRRHIIYIQYSIVH